MDRPAIRAALLLLGFEIRRSKYQMMLVDPSKDYGYIRVVVYPWWFIGVHTAFTIKNFVSPNKAWQYITKLREGGDMWKVIINGVDVGIIETDYAFAKHYWEARATRLNYSIKLLEITND